ncbi:hypothetical protein HB852_01770 [Listeria grandensis]|uniref:toxin Cry1Ac domain D-VI-related protein n=1 Tax=Listeria grandensis TaxID=1494963 RepID=UPI0016279CAB|nr:toxin Cry1Ac domain D-VI-related protein [Listeria grandensis]MBC1473347.1 hypothetical protein [Listeria grandensis]
MNKKMKKVAIALLATNVMASTVLTALPPVETHAAENKLTSTVSASQNNLINTVRDGDTKITGKVPGGAQEIEVSLWEYADAFSEQITSYKRYTCKVQSDANGNYSVNPENFGTDYGSIFTFTRRDYPYSVKIKTASGLTAETIIQMSKNTANTGYINPVKVGDTEITGHLDNRPLQAITFREVAAYVIGRTGTLPDRLSYTTTDANGDFKFTLTYGITRARLSVENDSGILFNTAPDVNEASVYVPTSLNVDTSAINAARGTTGKITATMSPAATNQALTYASSNANIITVNATGDWEAKATGTATITVTSTANASLTKTIPVTVTANAADVAQTTVNELFISDNPANHIKDTTTQAKIDTAQTKVDAVTDATKKAELQTYVDKAQAELANNAKNAAKASVDALFSNPPTNTALKPSTTQAIINEASTKVNALPASADKTTMQADITKANTLFQAITPTTLGALTTESTTVSGVGEPNSDIVITKGATILASGRVDGSGKYQLAIAKQPANTTITATVTKASNGKTSSASRTVTTVALDYKLTGPAEYELGNKSNITGNYGADVAYVRLRVTPQGQTPTSANVVRQVTALKGVTGSYNLGDISTFVKNTTDKVEILAVDSKYNIVKTLNVTPKGTNPGNALTGPAKYDLNNKANITGTYGSNVAYVRLRVTGASGDVTIKKQVSTTTTSNAYNLGDISTFVDATTQKLEIIAVDAKYNVVKTVVVEINKNTLDNKLTGPTTYTIGDKTAITGEYGTNVAYVRLRVTAAGQTAGTIVRQATGLAGTYSLGDISTLVTDPTSTVEILGVDAKYNIVKTLKVTVKASTVDNKLTGPSEYTVGDKTAVTGTTGTGVAFVRLRTGSDVNNMTVVRQATPSAGSYTLSDISGLVKDTSGVLQIVALDKGYNIINTLTVKVNPAATLDNKLTGPASYTFGDTTAITGTVGTNVARVRLRVTPEGGTAEIKKNINLLPGATDYNLGNIAGLVKNATDKVEILALDASYQVVNTMDLMN